MIEDDPSALDRYREEALRREFIWLCTAYSPYADMYTMAARFALSKLHEAKGGDISEVFARLDDTPPALKMSSIEP